jgi:MFS family permease
MALNTDLEANIVSENLNEYSTQLVLSHETVVLDGTARPDSIQQDVNGSSDSSRSAHGNADAPLKDGLQITETGTSQSHSLSSIPETISKDERFSRFTKKQKGICLFMVSLAGFLSPLSSLAYLPAVPEIADQFNTTGEVINISNAIYCIFMAISPCLFSPCSDIYGRKFTFIFCMSVFTICSVVVGLSQNLAMFYIFRSLTALFGTSFFSIGAHIVGDLYIPSERGKHMAWIIAGAQVGNSFGAVGGGIIVQYTSWRVIFYVLGGLGGLTLAIALVCLPETSNSIKYLAVLEEKRKTNPNKKFTIVPINPFGVITALKYPNLFIDGWIVICVLFTMFSLLTPIRYVMDPRFNLTEPIYSGLFYLPSGLGYIFGSFFGGRWADYYVKKYIKIRGRRVPEDRVRAALIPLMIYPICMLIYGWSVDKKVGGMAVPIIFMFFSGIAQTFIFPAVNTYCVDSMPEIGGDAIGSSYFSRYLAAAIASATCLKSINNIGVGWTCTISAFVLWSGFVAAVVLIKWGEGIRINALVRYGLRKPIKETSTEK